MEAIIQRPEQFVSCCERLTRTHRGPRWTPEELHVTETSVSCLQVRRQDLLQQQTQTSRLDQLELQLQKLVAKTMVSHMT